MPERNDHPAEPFLRFPPSPFSPSKRKACMQPYYNRLGLSGGGGGRINPDPEPGPLCVCIKPFVALVANRLDANKLSGYLIIYLGRNML